MESNIKMDFTETIVKVWNYSAGSGQSPVASFSYDGYEPSRSLTTGNDLPSW